MADDVRRLLDSLVPEDVVVEITGGKVGLRRHTGHGAGLAVYGMAVGAVWQACHTWAARDLSGQAPRPRIHAVTENQWTRGQAKWKRTAAVAAAFPQYDPATDPGQDMSDAIALAVWFCRERSVSEILL